MTEVTLEDGSAVATCEVYEVKIGSNWYVDNLSTNTTELYSIGNVEQAVDIAK